MAACDHRWILKLLSTRLGSINSGAFPKLGLDKPILLRSQKLISRALEGNKRLTLKELKVVLEKGRIPTQDMRISFILLRAALDGLIWLGPRQGKEFTYLLLDEWVPSGKEMMREEGLSELAKRYFQSHGPATLTDFIWWSGLKCKDAKVAIESVRPRLKTMSCRGKLTG